MYINSEAKEALAESPLVLDFIEVPQDFFLELAFQSLGLRNEEHLMKNT
jgi:hypothetical protein